MVEVGVIISGSISFYGLGIVLSLLLLLSSTVSILESNMSVSGKLNGFRVVLKKIHSTISEHVAYRGKPISILENKTIYNMDFLYDTQFRREHPDASFLLWGTPYFPAYLSETMIIENVSGLERTCIGDLHEKPRFTIIH